MQRSSWPLKSGVDENVRAYFNQKNSLRVENDVILLLRDGATRVVMPKCLQGQVLQLLHESHWSITRMKQMARRYVWWPNINNDIEKLVQRCVVCRQTAKAAGAKYQPWPKTEKPWERIHLDFAGPFLGTMWLVCVDAHSRYPYAAMLNIGQTNAKATIDALNHLFAIEGLPDTIVTDNGSQFTSQEFQTFCAQFGVVHLTSPVFHLASNGEAERFVQTFVLASYRCSPHPSLNWRTPAEVLQGRQPKNLLCLFSPSQTHTKHNDAHTHI